MAGILLHAEALPILRGCVVSDQLEVVSYLSQYKVSKDSVVPSTLLAYSQSVAVLDCSGFDQAQSGDVSWTHCLSAVGCLLASCLLWR